MASNALGLFCLLAVLPDVAGAQAVSGTTVPSPLQRFEADAPDSLILERTPCLGGACPAYRVALDRAGRVRFASGKTGTAEETHADSLTPLAMLYLMHQAERARVADLPLPLSGSSLCAHSVLDMPSVYVWVYRGKDVLKISDYQGCTPTDPAERRTLEALRTFEYLIDAVTGSYRWAEPRARSHVPPQNDGS